MFKSICTEEDLYLLETSNLDKKVAFRREKQN